VIPTAHERFNAAQYFVDRHVNGGNGAKVAIECGDGRVTYAELADRVNRLGNTLRETFDVRVEERVVLLLLDVPEFAYSFFGVMKIGAVAVPVNTLWKPADYEYVLNDARARVLIVSAELLPKIADIPGGRLRYLRHIVVVGTDATGAHSFDDLLAQSRGALDAADTVKDDAAFWLYSSGSTGAPKGCVHRHHDMVVTSECYAKGILGIHTEDRFFSVAKLFFAYGLGNGLYFPLSVGATAILLAGPPTAANVYGVIEAHRPTLLFSVPTGFAILLAHQRAAGMRDFDLSTVRLAISAGEALPPAVYERFKERFGIDILDGIGSTETLHMFISNRPDAIRAGSSGLVIPGYEARLVDEQNNAVARGNIGNLLIKGDSICTSYWNKHEKTRQTMEGYWIRTGDKYYQDEEGYFWYAGRTDDMLKVGGLWVSPVEVENALVEHPSVLECAVVGREDGDALVKPEAFVVVQPGVRIEPGLAQELEQFVRTRLADYKRPRWIQFVETLPRTATGKLQRFKLRA
jgi:benzoate-CoA ligase family protein